jgi:hypothetical protein
MAAACRGEVAEQRKLVPFRAARHGGGALRKTPTSTKVSDKVFLDTPLTSLKTVSLSTVSLPAVSLPKLSNLSNRRSQFIPHPGSSPGQALMRDFATTGMTDWK